MTQNDQNQVSLEQIENGLQVLKRRKRHLTGTAIAVSAIGFASLVTIFFQQDLVFHLFGLSLKVEQLHLPFILDESMRNYLDSPDYFMNAFSWLGWLILKMIVSFIGAFIIVGILKKFKFFLIRFQSFILRFVAWLIAFIVLWSGLTYVQYDFKDEEQSELASFVHYDQRIQSSTVYKYATQSDIPETVQDYLLAQTALLHKPMDLPIATAYTQKLVNAEKNDVNFLSYGLKPEQLWTIQQQVFKQAVSPIAQSVAPKVERAMFWSSLVQKLLWGITIISLIFGFFIYLTAQRIGKRLKRISANLI